MRSRTSPLLACVLAGVVAISACSDSGSSSSDATSPSTPDTSGAGTTEPEITEAPTTEATTTTIEPLTLESLSGRLLVESTSCDDQLRETNINPVGQICIVNLDDLTVVNISAPGIDETYPRWSPDGTRLAFNSQPDGGNQRLVLANADGSGRVNVTGYKFSSALFDWSPDGTSFLIGSRLLVPSNSVELNPSSDFRVPLDDNGWRPTFSPDGEWVAYSGDLYGTPDQLECQTLFIARIDGTDTQQLLPDPAGGDNLGPCVFDSAEWSPDGEWLLFGMSDNVGQNLWVMRADGSDLTQLTTGEFGGSRPNWSPDGRYIVYTADNAAGEVALMVRTFDGVAGDPAAAEALELPLPAGLLHGANWLDWAA